MGIYYYPWQYSFAAAFKDRPAYSAQRKIRDAETAMLKRQWELATKPQAEAEHHAIRNALFLLAFWRDRHRQSRRLRSAQ